MAHLLRPYKLEDKAFIYSTMLKGLYYGNSFFNQVDKATFFSHYAKVLDLLTARATTLIAHLPDEPDVIIGYAIIEHDTLHYIYTKAAFRKKCVASSLLKGYDIKRCSHLTDMVTDIRLSKHLIFNPFL